MPSCSLLDVVVQERSGGTAGDPPEAQLQCVAGDDPPAKAGAIGLAELVVVEEVAVLVGPSLPVIGYTSSSTMRCSTLTR